MGQIRRAHGQEGVNRKRCHFVPERSCMRKGNECDGLSRESLVNSHCKYTSGAASFVSCTVLDLPQQCGRVVSNSPTFTRVFPSDAASTERQHQDGQTDHGSGPFSFFEVFIGKNACSNPPETPPQSLQIFNHKPASSASGKSTRWLSLDLREVSSGYSASFQISCAVWPRLVRRSYFLPALSNKQ